VSEAGTPFDIGFTCQPTAEVVDALEALPIDSLWVGGHVAAPNPVPEAMGQLMRLGALTQRVRVGTAILLLPLYAPAIVAKQIADLDRVTHGRVTLGIGVGGEYPAEFVACGVPIAERGPRTDEAIPLLRSLWTGDEVSHAGRFHPMDGVRIHPAPAQPGGPPIVVAGRQPAAVRRAAVLGDGWMPYLYSARRFADSVRTVREEADRAGRDLATFEWMAFVFLAIDDDGDRARDGAAEFLGGTYRQDFRAFVDRVALAGTPEEVTRGLAAYVEAGVRHFIFAPASRAPTATTAQRLLGEIVPRLG
jgi:probable F420-dependent oxidoreductase